MSRLASLIVRILLLVPLSCFTACEATKNSTATETPGGLIVNVKYKKAQAVRNYPLAVMEAMREMGMVANREAAQRGKTIGSVRVTGGTMKYIFGPATAHVDLYGLVTYGKGWTGAVDDPTRLLDEAKLKQQGFMDTVGAINAMRPAPPTNVYIYH